MKRDNTIIIVIISTIGICVGMAAIAAIALLFLPGIIFFACMIMDDGGKLDNAEEISEAVTENQETLEELVSQVLEPENDLDFVINVEEKEFNDMSASMSEDEEAYNLEDIYRLSEEMDIKKIYIYKNSDIHVVIFQTATSGLSVSGSEQGFLYIDQDIAEDITEDITEHTYFKVYRRHEYSEIINNWYYFDIIY